MRLPHLHVCKAPLPTTYATCHPKSPSIDLPLAPAGRGATTLFAAEPIARDLLALCALPSCLDQMRRGKEDDHGEATATATMGRGGGAASSEEEEEEDFMSDSFLTTAEKLQEKHQEDTYSGRRRRALNAGSQSARVLSRVEREKQARAEGLGRSLFERRGSEADGGADTDGARKRRRREDDDGMDKNAGSPVPLHAGSKAMNMMRAMGFQHGQALGKHEPDATQDGATEVDERQPAAPPSSLAPLTEPLALDERWLGHKSRTGIGSMPPRAALALSRDISEAASREQKDSAALDASQAFRRRAGEEHKVRHWQALLVNARSTCEDLDRTLGIEYSPLWIDAEALSKPRDQLPAHVASIIEHALAGLEGEAEGDREAIDRAKEARQFCLLKVKARLDVTLSHLRRAHCYCLFCGHRYASDEDLERSCPGEQEDDH